MALPVAGERTAAVTPVTYRRFGDGACSHRSGGRQAPDRCTGRAAIQPRTDCPLAAPTVTPIWMIGAAEVLRVPLPPRGGSGRGERHLGVLISNDSPPLFKVRRLTLRCWEQVEARRRTPGAPIGKHCVGLVGG